MKLNYTTTSSIVAVLWPSLVYGDRGHDPVHWASALYEFSQKILH